MGVFWNVLLESPGIILQLTFQLSLVWWFQTFWRLWKSSGIPLKKMKASNCIHDRRYPEWPHPQGEQETFSGWWCASRYGNSKPYTSFGKTFFFVFLQNRSFTEGEVPIWKGSNVSCSDRPDPLRICRWSWRGITQYSAESTSYLLKIDLLRFCVGLESWGSCGGPQFEDRDHVQLTVVVHEERITSKISRFLGKRRRTDRLCLSDRLGEGCRGQGLLIEIWPVNI